MKKVILSGLLVIFLITSMAVTSPEAMVKAEMTGEMICNKSVADIRVAMRKLWEDHIMYTRNYIISAVADLDEAGTFAQRLLKNQDDIKNVVRPVYGDEAGKQLAALLRKHISIATRIVKAAKLRESGELSKAKHNLEANADDIVALLNGANPQLPRQECGQYAL